MGEACGVPSLAEAKQFLETICSHYRRQGRSAEGEGVVRTEERQPVFRRQSAVEGACIHLAVPKRQLERQLVVRVYRRAMN